MYQEIDDPEWEEAEEKERKRALWLGLCFTLTLGLAALSLWFIFRPITHTTEPIDTAHVRTLQYRTALSEPSPPLRRARLMDFLETYPDTPQKSAVIAQLSILNTAESKDWATLTDSIYNPAVNDTKKQAAINDYIRKWGPVYLGTRENEISEFTENLAPEFITPETETQNIESPETQSQSFSHEDFQAPPPDYPITLSDTVLAGGLNRPARESVKTRAMRTVTHDKQPTIMSPKVRRNITPRYPKSAQRKGIEGRVTLSLNIDAQGRVERVNLISVNAKRYGRDFTKSAIRAAKRTQFFPQTVGGVPTPVKGVIKRYRFEIED